MTTCERITLEDEITRFLAASPEAHELPAIVRRFRDLADDASIKAALLRLNAEGLLEITPSWQFRGSTASQSL